MKVTIQGNVTRALELQTSAKGAIYTRLPLAVDSTDDYGRKSPTFIDITVFGERAEALVNDLKVGDFLQVEMRMTNRALELADGKKQYGYNFTAGEIVRLREAQPKEAPAPVEAPKKKRTKKAKAA